jgi:hypothetical protein
MGAHFKRPPKIIVQVPAISVQVRRKKMALREGLEFLSERRKANQAKRAERARQASIKREAERQRREAERNELLARLTERFQKQFGWNMIIIDYMFDAWGDPVYRLDDGVWITISERNPLSYRKKPEGDPFRNFREEYRINRMKDEISAEVLEAVRRTQAKPAG